MKCDRWVSNCCNEPNPDYPDSDVCPKCKEHAGFEEEKWDVE